ncbi:MAG TPA: putative zinc-binding metallopeptidase [Pirellulales bacterium]|jgi:hypothetical protein|nr:putative zinc-binding metallopeptidase [Pirellulales bacterium]
MRVYECVCGQSIFFDNSTCLSCARPLGFCPVCRNLAALDPQPDGTFRCLHEDCGAALAKCFNNSQYNVCNRCVALPAAAKALCDCCRFNSTIPDLSVPGNQEKWYRLEAAKRRLFYDLSQLGLPYGLASDGVEPPLAFDFKADLIPKNDFWRGVGKAEQVYTGHAHGRITINIREADDVEREKLRVVMHESQRTLIGHFRHEIGHYYWDMLVKDQCEDACRAVFGNHDQPTYAEALERYYKEGPPANWREHFISAYATMHPWEDFAETWASYLDMVSALDTADHMGFGGATNPLQVELDRLVHRYQELGIALNEINRSVGLIDVVPEVFVQPVIQKMRFIHDLVRAGRAKNGMLTPPDAATAADAKMALA